MKNYKLEVMAGQHFLPVSVRAQIIAQTEKRNVEFNFNGITCIVDAVTNLDHLFRDYGVAHTMEWSTIGPVCEAEYSGQIQAELDERNALSAKRREAEQQKREEKNNTERIAFEQAVAGIDLDLVERFKYNNWKAKNTDPYGRTVFEYAEGWGRLMQKAMANGQSLAECARPTSFQLGFLGISGMQYSMAARVLIQSWAHGKELAEWHEKKPASL